ncbi:hypothetical protein AAGS40_15850 [Paraburkholderia sp. PREW-6R]|uniref:hypothetical protein n=1 Tax=Paraburkholderia sp. PREW-6R TaxID=3141544 RepID=UPI0031F5B0AD
MMVSVEKPLFLHAPFPIARRFNRSTLAQSTNNTKVGCGADLGELIEAVESIRYPPCRRASIFCSITFYKAWRFFDRFFGVISHESGIPAMRPRSWPQ